MDKPKNSNTLSGEKKNNLPVSGEKPWKTR